MKTSEQINELALALSKAQGEIENAGKDGSNPHFNSKYATLASVLIEVRKVLNPHGLSVVQTTEVLPDGMVLNTMLMHSTGQFITAQTPLMLQKQDMQGLGSAITYARRYSLAAMFGIAQEDDDGNKACEPKHDTDFDRPITKSESKDDSKPPVKNYALKPDPKASCDHKWAKSQFKNKVTGKDQEYCGKCRSQRDLEELPF